MDEPTRSETMSFKLNPLEREEIRKAAALAGATDSAWVRELALRAARGKRTEVKTDDLTWLRQVMNRQLALQLEHIRLMHEHLTPHPSSVAELKARERADRAMNQTLQRLGYEGPQKNGAV